MLAFTDADCMPRPTGWSRGSPALEGAESWPAAVRFTVEGRLTPWALLDIEHNLDQEAGVRRDVAVTANLFMRRETFDAIGGFDETLPSGPDHDAVGRAVRAGAVLRYAAEAGDTPSRPRRRGRDARQPLVHASTARRAGPATTGRARPAASCC